MNKNRHPKSTDRDVTAPYKNVKHRWTYSRLAAENAQLRERVRTLELEVEVAKLRAEVEELQRERARMPITDAWMSSFSEGENHTFGTGVTRSVSVGISNLHSHLDFEGESLCC